MKAKVTEGGAMRASGHRQENYVAGDSIMMYCPLKPTLRLVYSALENEGSKIHVSF